MRLFYKFFHSVYWYHPSIFIAVILGLVIVSVNLVGQGRLARDPVPISPTVMPVAKLAIATKVVLVYQIMEHVFVMQVGNLHFKYQFLINHFNVHVYTTFILLVEFYYSSISLCLFQACTIY